MSYVHHSSIAVSKSDNICRPPTVKDYFKDTKHHRI